MGDSAVAVTPGAGANIDTRTQASGDHRQVVVLGDGSSVDTAAVSASGALEVTNNDNGSRISISLYATASAAGATTVEAAQNVALVRGVTATAAAASVALTAGKTTRITGIRFRSTGHATATTQSTIHKLRLNIAGAVATTTTPILFQARTTTPATSLASDFVDIPLEHGGFDIVVPGGGNYQIGVTAASTFTTNAPTWDVMITGYEFTA